MTLEQTLDYKEEQFDFIQQTLRCICMKCKSVIKNSFFQTLILDKNND